MSTHVRTLIIGAGQAGLALSRCLTEASREHLMLDRGRVAERWRSERWDSFRLLTPNWQTRLPGYRYTGSDPDGFMTGAEVVDFFTGYARSFAAPVHTGVTVTTLDPTPSGWVARARDGEEFHASEVVVATGHYDRPAIPSLASELPNDVHQLHTGAYRNPGELPSGAVLVVGSGPSGQQIADELARAGRRVYIATGHHRPLPRRYRGRDVYWWMDRIGMLRRTIDSLPSTASPQNAPSVVLAGGVKDLNLHRLAEHGVVIAGRLADIGDGKVHFAADLPDRLAEADYNGERLRTVVDDYIRRYGVDAPPPDAAPPTKAAWAHAAPRRLDLRTHGITSVLWATGYRRDFSWVNAPVFDVDDEPIQRRGITPAAGLYFLGLRWMYRRNSNFIDGVAADAAHLAAQLVGRRVDEPLGVLVG